MNLPTGTVRIVTERVVIEEIVVYDMSFTKEHLLQIQSAIADKYGTTGPVYRKMNTLLTEGYFTRTNCGV